MGGIPLPEVTKDEVMKALEPVQDPEIGRSIVEMGMVRSVDVKGADVAVEVALTVPGCPLAGYMKKSAEDAVKAIPGVKNVSVKMDAMSDAEREAAFKKIRGL
jgi:ATP-binding protein involved in chromosome partitioning